MLRTGERHIDSLRDSRAVFIDGRRVDDVTADPRFRNAVASIGALYDFQSAPENRELMTYAVGGTRVNRIWQLPASYAELVERRRALEAWAELHCGFIGRAPDHVASCISGMYMGLAVFEHYDPKRAAALSDYYRYARDNDLYLTYAIINPQADRSKGASGQQTEFLTRRRGRPRRGAESRCAAPRCSATGAADGQRDLRHVHSAAAARATRSSRSRSSPGATPGLKILSRKSYEEASPSLFDNPLASRFDENDAVIYFDDVHVPWERVFVDSHLEMCQRQFHATPAHVYQNYQSMIRLTVKLRFLLGIARRIAEINGIIAFAAGARDARPLAAEVGDGRRAGRRDGSEGPRRAERTSSPTITRSMRRKSSPSSSTRRFTHAARPGRRRHDHAAVDGPRFRQPRDRRSDRGHTTVAGSNAHDKVKFYKLAWDAVGSEFALAAHPVRDVLRRRVVGHAGPLLRTYDWDRATGLVDRRARGLRSARSRGTLGRGAISTPRSVIGPDGTRHPRHALSFGARPHGEARAFARLHGARRRRGSSPPAS